MEPTEQTCDLKQEKNNTTIQDKSTRPHTMIRIESQEKFTQEESQQIITSKKPDEIPHQEPAVTPPALTAIVIENENTLQQIPKGIPTYYQSQSEKEFHSLKISYGVCSFFIICSLIVRIIPQFAFKGCLISGSVWILSLILYVTNVVLFYKQIKNRFLLTMTVWMICNSLCFLSDLIATILAFRSPLYSDDCESDCDSKKTIKNTFSIINVVSLLVIGVANGFFSYKGYQIRELIISQQQLSHSVPVSQNIEF